MSSFTYPAKFTAGRDGRVLVEFFDLPRVSTHGKNDREAMGEAMDALGSDLSIRLARREEVPAPSAVKRGQRLVPVPLWLAPKLALYLAMRDQQVNNSELARRLGVHERVIRRMLDPEHASKAERIQALAAFPRWRAANRRPARAFGVIGFAGNRRYPCIAGFRFGRPSEAGRRNSSTACAG